ncbi:MAG: hypothetical protein ABI968_13390 [Acidobacteriota bacterium]
MITILVVGPSPAEPSEFAQSHPSVEILTAAGAEDALEKLARNRRIDAVLLLPGAAAAEIIATLREEDPGAPPVFAPDSMGPISGARPLRGDDSARLLDLLVDSLASET